MPKDEVNYDRILDLKKKGKDKFKRDNYLIFESRAKSSSDIYHRDFMLLSSSNTDRYAEQLNNERWNDFFIVDNVEDLDDELEEFSNLGLGSILKLEDLLFDGTHDLRIGITFFLIIENHYDDLSSEIKDLLKEVKDDLVVKLRDFTKSSRYSVKRSYIKFLVKKMGYKNSEAKKLMNKVKKIIKSL